MDGEPVRGEDAWPCRQAQREEDLGWGWVAGSRNRQTCSELQNPLAGCCRAAALPCCSVLASVDPFTSPPQPGCVCGL